MPGERPSFEGEDFLKKKYGLHASDEVAEAAARTEEQARRANERLRFEGKEGPLESEKVSQKPADRIRNYLSRFEDILERPSEDDLDSDEEYTHTRERGIEALKRIFHKKFVIRPGDVPESVFLLEQRIARDLGHGTVEITDEFKGQKTSQIIADQEASLDKWIDYLASPDADYPDWARYWATRSVLEMGKFQKKETEDGGESARFGKRTKDTAASFAPMNPRALAMTIGAMKSWLEEQGKPKVERQPVRNVSAKLDDPAFQELLTSESFAKLYAQFLIEMPEYSAKGLEEIRGKWVTDARGSDPKRLVASLDGYPLEWCTANIDTAGSQLQGGDFHTYYSLNEAGEAVIPRAAIRMEGDSIAEVRGIAPNQNLDPFIGDVVGAKMKEFPDGAAYEKKAGDMKLLTAIEQKVAKNQPLTKDDLVFLYELNGVIEGFGYGRDPRVTEIRDKRDPKEDAPILFECEPGEIAWSSQEISPTTKAYIGPLFPGVFELPNLEHLYTNFPEGRIERRTLEIGGKTPEEYEAEITAQGHQTNEWSKGILAKTPTSKEAKKLQTVRLTVADLGFTEATRYDEICRRAKELGLDLAPAETGPALRLAMTDQKMGDSTLIGMEAISDRYGSPYVFRVGRDRDGSWLLAHRGEPGIGWPPGSAFMFVPRKQ